MYKNGDHMANDRFFIVKSVLMTSWSKCCGMMESASRLSPFRCFTTFLQDIFSTTILSRVPAAAETNCRFF